MQMQIRFDSATVRSYATEENLQKALTKYGFQQARHIIVKTEDNRWTAIFAASNFRDGGYVGVFADKGFYTFG